MNKRMKGLMAMIAGALMVPAFATPPNPFNGAFVEGALGGSSGAVKTESVTRLVNGGGRAVSVDLDKSKSAFAGRVGVGYGYDLPYSIGYTNRESGVSRQFNLTGMLTYSISQKVSAASKIKNSVGLLFQPGYYLPLKSTPVLIYGTVGYAWASLEQRERERIPVDGRQLFPGDTSTAAIYNSPLLVDDGNERIKGLVLGVGAKYAITDRLYAGFDYTHTEYDYKKDGQILGWGDGEARLASGDRASVINVNTDWRIKGVKTDTFLLTVGFRFF